MPNPYTSPLPSLVSILRWQISKRFMPRAFSLPIPVIPQKSLPSGEYVLWLGHATLWLGLGRIRLAIDPVLGNIPFYPRHTPLPIPQENLSADLILITHAHYDHFDRASLLILLRHNPNTHMVVPKGFWRYLKGYISKEDVFELEWWESITLMGITITLVPSKHWSRRTPFDTNKALWGGYVIQNEKHSLYHAGDTAAGDHFKEIGERFEIDEAFLPIGAYRPEIIMQHNHTNPPEALDACSDLRAKTMIPIHYGTFKLSDEPLHEPLEWFETLVEGNHYPFIPKVLRIGEIYRFNTTSTFTST